MNKDKRYTCIYYVLPGGRIPVQDFIDSLDEDTQDAFFFKVELLDTFGTQLRHPHTDDLGGGIFELRFFGREGRVRILFFFYHSGRIIFTNGFIKKTPRTPLNELETAHRRRKEYLRRKQDL